MSETTGALPPPRHVGTNVFVWASNVRQGDNFYASPEDMRAGIKCLPDYALYRVRLIKVGPEPTIYKRVWWDDDRVDDEICVERPPDDTGDDFIVNSMEYADVYPTKEMVELEGDWYFVDWMWREKVPEQIEYQIFNQGVFDQDLYERVVIAQATHTPWTNDGEDPNSIFECILKLAPHEQEREVYDHPMNPQLRVVIEIENKPGEHGWGFYVVEHYFVEQ